MFKASIELATITKSCKLRFGLIIKDDNPKNVKLELISKFNMGGNEYLKLRPYPYITIDITSSMDKKSEWNSNQSFNLNKKDLFKMIQSLKRLMKNFIEYKDLFYYDMNSNLKVNPDVANDIREIIICGNKTILMQPCVVNSEEDHVDYEGLFLSINSIDYFSYLTYNEAEYLLYELQHVNMTELSLQLLNTVKLTEEMEAKKLNTKPPLAEQKEPEIEDIKPSSFGKPPKSSIPDI